MNILITSPSLNENENVSGISSLVKNIISNKFDGDKFIHLKLGKTDHQKKSNLEWYINQLILIPTVILKLLRNKIDLVHLNTGLEKASVIRDYIVFIIAKKVFRKKTLFHIHGGFFLMQPPPVNSIYFKMIRSITKKADLVIVLSGLEKRQVDDTYQTNSHILINAIDIPPSLKTNKREFNKPLKLIFLGRIVKSKGVFVILHCLEKMEKYFNDFHLDVYGAGSETEAFLNGLNSIKGLSYSYHGVAAGEKKWEALKGGDIFLLPSIHSEGLPIAIIEAMAAGCVALVSDDASISTVVINKQTGYVVKRGDENGLSDKLKYILSNTEELSSISRNANKFVLHNHEMATYMKNLDIYYKLC
ncbi:glycosyltransferase family 4 protein [Mucilaginibacter mali]|uniref:Glycosyltransferase family 4 protein n=1 Tax=Mucilaginibacter mali TaxID=2740462 RepID=A0A7D4UMW4_9SPHI|nr:glycosyltransferase family 4 protein [Mucilaginibacter mali]QKJ31481.1 glycosyltransferase family 4 protein [Mucilaginibacter mali]